MPDNIQQDHTSEQVVAVFHGVNAVDPPHLIPQDEVQTATSIDFTLEHGGAAVRRGSVWQFGVANGADTDNMLAVEFLGTSMGAIANTDGAVYVSQSDV